VAATLECPRCSSADVININLTMETEEPVSFYSCHACEHRWWDKAGTPLELTEVLGLAKRLPRRAVRKP
jgi:transposase-like protein